MQVNSVDDEQVVSNYVTAGFVDFNTLFPVKPLEPHLDIQYPESQSWRDLLIRKSVRHVVELELCLKGRRPRAGSPRLD